MPHRLVLRLLAGYPADGSVHATGRLYLDVDGEPFCVAHGTAYPLFGTGARYDLRRWECLDPSCGLTAAVDYVIVEEPSLDDLFDTADAEDEQPTFVIHEQEEVDDLFD